MKNCFYIYLLKIKRDTFFQFLIKQSSFDFYQKPVWQVQTPQLTSALTCLWQRQPPCPSFPLSSISGWCKCCFFSTILFSLWMPWFWLLSVDDYLFCVETTVLPEFGAWNLPQNLQSIHLLHLNWYAILVLELFFTNFIMHLFRISLLIPWNSTSHYIRLYTYRLIITTFSFNIMLYDISYNCSYLK